jgi:indole-3-glycerol phosphate synthase
MATYLDSILAAHRRRAAADQRDTEELVAACADLEPTRGFAAALTATDELSVIAEIKRRSPSKGPLNPDLDPQQVARAYLDGGAAALSVLTDEDFFGGSAADLAAARAAVPLPVIRKDFTVSANDVCDARLMGADCVLLIVAALSDSELETFSALAERVGLDALIETHDEVEVERALQHTTARLIGVNQRDLVTFNVDQARAVRVADTIPSTSVKVAESGVTGHEDALALAAAGYRAVLVGEHLVTSASMADSLKSLRVPLAAR